MRAFNANDYFKFLVVFSLVLLGGCAENSYTVQKGMTDAVEAATLREIRVSGDGAASKIEIEADRPLTYTSYSDKDPRRLVLDISNAEPGSVKVPQLEPSFLVKKIDVSKSELTAGSLVRITMEAADDVDYAVNSNPANMSVVTVTASPKQKTEPSSAPQASVAGTSSTEPVAVAAEKKDTETAAPVAAAVKPDQEKTAGNTEAPATTSGNAKTHSLTGLEVVSDGIDIRTNAPVQKFRYFNMSNPQRLVVDLFGFKNTLGRSVKLDAFGIDTARIGSYAEKTRIVFDSKESAFPKYTLEKSAAGLKLNISTPASSKGAPVVAATPPEAKEQPTPAVVPVSDSKQPSIEAIDFKVLDGVSRIQVSVAGGCDMAEPVRTATGLMLTFKSCQLPKSLQRPYDTSKFDSVVKNMTPYQVATRGKKNAKINVVLRESAPYTVKKEGSEILIDISNPKHYEVASQEAGSKPVALVNGNKEAGVPRSSMQRAEGGLERKQYTGKRVTLEFADADIRKIFQLIGEVSNLNILVGDDVTGTISIKLVNVPWDQALDVILDTKNLAMKRSGNIVVIRPRDKMTTQADEEVAAKKAYEKTLELRTKIFDVNYADAKDIATQFASYKSERGSITTDTRTNKVIVSDITPAIEKMEALMKELDVPEKQVLIEARIVEATSDLTRDLGIQWGTHYNNGTTATLNTGFGGTVTNLVGTAGFATGYGAAMGMTLGKLARDFQLDMRLSAAESLGYTKIISSPKVLTLNNKAAKISQGKMQPYQTTSSEGTKTEFVEAALKLEVTPHITPNGQISMKIKANNDTVGDAPTGTAPPINKKEATTEMIVANGETTVIGGIYKDDEASTDTGVPLLKDIPVLGWLFKSNTTKKTKTELLIFITPRIVE